MSVPKTPKEFDYDLWTAKDGEHMVRVKATGEVCKVNSETMRFLRAEEKRLRRSWNKCSQTAALAVKEPILSLDYLKQEARNNFFTPFLARQGDLEENVVANIMIKQFLALLTPNQLDAYENCILDGKSYVEYAAELGIPYQYIQKRIMAIRKKAKKFFG